MDCERICREGVEKRMQSKALHIGRQRPSDNQPKAASLPPLGLVIGGGGSGSSR